MFYGWIGFELEEWVYVTLIPHMAIRNHMNQIIRFYNY